MRRLAILATGFVALVAADACRPALHAQGRAAPVSFAETICLALAKASIENDLPIDFFSRLIWQESHFDSRAQSYAGAQGIAQFMPATARSRGLVDPFDPVKSLRESAKFLHELRQQFGNLGLAAAAYNAGPSRVLDWLAGRKPLPGQTRAYVRIITGRSVDEWIGVTDKPDDRMGNTISCDDVAKLLAARDRESVPKALVANRSAWAPWGLQLAGDWSESRALAEYRQLQRKFPKILGARPPLVIRGQIAGRGSAAWYRVRVAEPTRESAVKLCTQLEQAGGKCLVFRN